MEHISIIPDYRQAWKVEHKLSDILLLTICAVISGAEGWEDIADFGETHLDFLKQYGDFEHGIPAHDTIARVVSCISPAKFHECFINWMRDCHSSDDKDVIAIDGKTLRHSYDKSRRRGAIHVISAFSTMHTIGRKHYLRLNGNRQDHPDDGYNFRGRGLIQITGYEKYNGFSTEYNLYWPSTAPDTVSHPEEINEMPYAIRSALWFWVKYKPYNADTGGGYDDVENVTIAVNGGIMGLTERQEAYRLCEQVFL